MMKPFVILILLCCHSCSTFVQGPKEAKGNVGGSLNVTCTYKDIFRNVYKWWCRGNRWRTCKYMIQSTGKEKEVKKDRVTLRDNQRENSFTVTMENITIDDTDVYICGIGAIGIHFVKVTVMGPVIPTTPTMTTTTTRTMKPTKPTTTTRTTRPTMTTTTTKTTTTMTTKRKPALTEETTYLPNENVVPAKSTISLPMPLLLAVTPAMLLFPLFVAALLIRRKQRRQMKATRVSPKPDAQEKLDATSISTTPYTNTDSGMAPSTSRIPEVAN